MGNEKKGLSAFALGLLLASPLCIYNSAYALNGYTNVSTCASCKTTADFTAAAIAQSNVEGVKGTYLIVSESNASQAFMKVTGEFDNIDGERIWNPEAATPVDGSGNSLAGQSEATLEAFYQLLDQMNFGTSRDAPFWLNASNPQQALLPTSFGLSSDEQVSDVIDYLDTGPSDPSIGYICLVTFPNGDTAQFQLTQTGSSKLDNVWTWVPGKAWDKNGNQLKRDGSRATNPNTGGGGVGSASVTGASGAAAGWRWELTNGGGCTFQTTITVNAESTDYTNISPC